MAHQLSLSPPQPGATGGKPRPLVLAAGVRGAMGAAPVRTRLAAAERPLRRAFCLWEVTRTLTLTPTVTVTVTGTLTLALALALTLTLTLTLALTRTAREH